MWFRLILSNYWPWIVPRFRNAIFHDHAEVPRLNGDSMRPVGEVNQLGTRLPFWRGSS